MDSSVAVMCASAAINMGVDKSNVDLMIHIHMPCSIASYNQETGRVACDIRIEGPAILLHHPDDEVFHRHQIMNGNEYLYYDDIIYN